MTKKILGMAKGGCCTCNIILRVMVEKRLSPSAIRHLHLHAPGVPYDIKPLLTEYA